MGKKAPLLPKGMVKKAQNPVLVHESLLIHHGREPMFIPEGGCHVRQVYLEFAPYKDRPTINVTIYSDTDPGNVFGVFGVSFVSDATGFVGCKITAHTTHNPTQSEYFCDYMIMGAPMKAKRSK